MPLLHLGDCGIRMAMTEYESGVNFSLTVNLRCAGKIFTILDANHFIFFPQTRQTLPNCMFFFY